MTALHYAILFELTDITKLLIKHGAKIDIKNNNGQTPLDQTTEEVRNRATMARVKYKCKFPKENKVTTLMKTIIEENTESVAKLIPAAKKNVINAQDIDGMTALHYAILFEHFDIIELLDQNKYIIETIKDKLGYTPAEYYPNDAILQYLHKLDYPPTEVLGSKQSYAPYIIGLVGVTLGLYLANKLIRKKQQDNKVSLPQTSEQDLNVEAQQQ